MSLTGIAKSMFSLPRFKKRDFDPEKVSIEDIHLPIIINTFEDIITVNMVKDEYSTYKSLDYKDKTIETLNTHVYHSFQIGLMLKYIKINRDMFIPNLETIFPKIILNTSKRMTESKIFDIIKKYDEKIKINLTSEQLTNDIQWTPLETGYLLYYIATYKS